tara:strand:- start:1571 stop:2296 length:726 start_codon:yes stop_codon:yes gene_type:complete
MANEIKTYSTKETAEILGIKERAVQTRCKKYNIRKKDNKYLITDLIIADWKQKEEANAKANATSNANANAKQEVAHAIAQKVAQDKIKKLEEEIKTYDVLLYKYELELEELDKARVEIKELKEELSGYEITENERLEVFTNEEYAKFEERLTQWRLQSQHIITQQKDNEHQQELFNAKVLTLEQSEEHYKNSYFYQRKQNERFIDMHEKLLDTIQLSGKENMIKTVKDAKNTDWTNKQKGK